MKGFAAIIILLCVVVISFLALNTNNYAIESDSQKELVSQTNQAVSSFEVVIRQIASHCTDPSKEITAACIDANAITLAQKYETYGCQISSPTQYTAPNYKLTLSCFKDYKLKSHQTTIGVSKEVIIPQ